MKALVFAAGLGTRLRPLTDTMPKALVPVGGLPLLAHTLNRLIAQGATEIVVNVHHFSEQIIAYLDKHDFGVPVRVSDETARLLDTGGGLRKALSLFQTEPEKPVLIHNVDILSNAPLRQFYEEHLSDDAALMVSQRTTSRLLFFDEGMRLCGWKNVSTGEARGFLSLEEAQTCSSYAFSGIHLVSPRLLHVLSNYGECFPIIHFYLSECHRLRIVGHCVSGLQLLDVGKTAALEQAETFAQAYCSIQD